MSDHFGRRRFLKNAGSTALAATAVGAVRPGFCFGSHDPASFRSAWLKNAERPWPGPEYWANPLQDWQIRQGRVECIGTGEGRNLALLTRDVAERSGDLYMSVRCGALDKQPLGEGCIGFRIGAKHQMGDFRAAAVYGRGLDAGIDTEGRLFIGERKEASSKINLSGEIQLELQARPSASGYLVTLRASTRTSGIAKTTREVPASWLTGGVALLCSAGPPAPDPLPLAPLKDFDFYPPRQQSGGACRCWFSDWVLAGSKLDEHEDRAYGPVFFSLYTLSRNTLKLSAQLAPLGNAAKTVELQISAASGEWRTVATAELDPDAWNATFRLISWDPSKEVKYRILYVLANGRGESKHHTYEGTIRRDPVDNGKLTVGLLTCLWDFGFPHRDFVANLACHKPDILLWTGDQIYEQVGGFGAIRSRDPAMAVPAMLDFLRKWIIFGWAVGELTRQIPSVCMTDDHDMFHGNIWGCGGRPTNPGATTLYDIQDSGGYKMSPRWVNMVQRVQTAHLPDPFDSQPVEQHIGVYYTELQYGGVSFAILEDRKWKSAPREHLPDAHIVNGFALNLDWQPATQGDVAGAELLGQRQLDFLEYWAADWGGGTWMKFAVSQTPFACMHTEPSGEYTDKNDPFNLIPAVGIYVENDRMIADHDSAGWPQHGRNQAISKCRKAFAAHLCGDQHLGSTVQYGVNNFRDGVYSICTPAISNIFPRRWFPPVGSPADAPEARYLGDHRDAFGNRFTVLAVANPAQYPGPGLDGLRHRVTGYTILKCERSTREVTVAEWPRWVDPSRPGAQPYPGWPLMIDQLDNGLRDAMWELDRIETEGFRDAVVQVRLAATGETVYTLRVPGTSFLPRVRQPGTYTVLAYDPDGGYFKEWPSMDARRRQ